MKVLCIDYPESFEEMKDMIVINVTCDREITFPLTVVTPIFYKKFMQKEKECFYPPEIPHIIVKYLRKEIIEQAVYSHVEDEVEDGYWLKIIAILEKKKDAFTIHSMNKIYNLIDNQEY